MRRSGAIGRCGARGASFGGLGSAELVKLADARKVAADNRAIARTGEDLRRSRVPTFEKAEAGCFAEKRENWRSDGPANGWRSAMERYVLPKLGAMPVDNVGSAAVYEVPRPLALAGKHATVKVAGTAITAVLEWARVAEFRAEGSPVETVRRRLPKRAGGRKHYDAPRFSEVAGALARIDATNCAPSTKRAIRFTALTVSRQVEVHRAMWDRFDLEAAVRIKPAEATKTAKSHRVPLSRQALAVLAEARKGNRGALVLAGTRPGAMMGIVVMTQALRNAGVAAPGRRFRSSFKGWARQHDVDELLSEFSLAHVEGPATVAAYARDDLLEKRRPFVQAWADCCISG